MSSYARLPQDLPDTDIHPNTTSPDNNNPSHHASSLRIYWLTAVVCCGGLLFGYDSGVIGGVLTFDSFRRDFQYTTENQTRVSATAVGIQQAGALLGCLLIWPLTNRHGRRKAMMLCSAIFCAGVIFEIVNSHSLLLFYVGRIFCGLGVGGSATTSPIYLAEMSPKNLRARLGSGYQFTFTIGISISYWIDYALQFRDPSPAQWQIPLALQLIPGALMGLGIGTLHESVRWLLASGDNAAAWSSLVWIRGTTPNDPGREVYEEFAEVKRALDEDHKATADFHPRELLHRPNLHRITLAVGLFLAQQATGATAMAYFGPQFFGLLVGSSTDNSSTSTAWESVSRTESESDTHTLTLLLTALFGALKVTSCLFFILFMADRFGRRPLLINGALGMGICFISTSILLKSTFSQTPTPTSPTSPSLPSSTISTITLIYLSITLYNNSWGPLPWPLSAEIFPTRLRSPGVAIAVSAQWTSNLFWSFATPYLLEYMGWATFLLFGGLDLGIAGCVWGCVPETRGLSLEGVQGLFEGVGEVFGRGGGEDREGLVGGGLGRRDSVIVWFVSWY
ncbi:hypothetical protein BDV12DRAFT_209800 [Aspergillus spectabilis]